MIGSDANRRLSRRSCFHREARRGDGDLRNRHRMDRGDRALGAVGSAAHRKQAIPATTGAALAQGQVTTTGVFIEASGCDEAADIALEDFKSEPQPDDVVEDGSAEVVESVHDRDP